MAAVLYTRPDVLGTTVTNVIFIKIIDPFITLWLECAEPRNHLITPESGGQIDVFDNNLYRLLEKIGFSIEIIVSFEYLIN